MINDGDGNLVPVNRHEEWNGKQREGAHGPGDEAALNGMTGSHGDIENEENVVRRDKEVVERDGGVFHGLIIDDMDIS